MKKEILNEIVYEKQNLKYFYILSLFYFMVMSTSLTLSARLVPVHIPFTDTHILVTGATWIIPLSFLIQDIITEVYGYLKAKRLVQICLILLLIYILYLRATTFFPTPNETPGVNSSYNAVFYALPKHLCALLVSVFIGNLINDYLLSNFKKRLQGKHLPLRLMVSSAVGSLALQCIGTTIAWLGSLSFSGQILPFIMFSYLYKLLFEILTMPMSVYVCYLLKKHEGVDVYDTNVNYNPLSFQ